LVHAAAVGFILPQAAQNILAERGVKLYAICRPGFGNSDPAADLGPVEGGAKAIEALQAHLGIERCLGVAFSSAIIPLLRYASRAPFAMPQLIGIGGCIPLDQVDHLPVFQRVMFKLVQHAPWAAKLYAHAAYRVVRSRGAEWYLRRVYAECPPDLAALSRPDVLPLVRSSADMQFAQGMEAAEEELKLLLARWHEDLRYDGPHITMLHGMDDRFYPVDQLQEFAARHANLDIQLVENAGDLIAFQHPELIAQRIVDLALQTVRQTAAI
jgi:pimeloyl-ACP methyl ester carboxylesterase